MPQHRLGWVLSTALVQGAHCPAQRGDAVLLPWFPQQHRDMGPSQDKGHCRTVTATGPWLLQEKTKFYFHPDVNPAQK